MRTSESEAESVGVYRAWGFAKFAVYGQDHYDNVISVEKIHQDTMGDVVWKIPKDNGLSNRDEYPSPPTPISILWKVRSHHQYDDLKPADVDMRGKRKRTVDEQKLKNQEVTIPQLLNLEEKR